MAKRPKEQEILVTYLLVVGPILFLVLVVWIAKWAIALNEKHHAKQNNDERNIIHETYFREKD